MDTQLPGFTPWPQEFADRYRGAGYWRGEVLGDLLRHPPAANPAVVTRSHRYTYGELDARADELASGLADLGIARRDRVVVALPNTVDFVTTTVALFRIGALPVFALPAHRRAELTYLSEYSEAVALITPSAELAREVGRAVSSLKHVLTTDELAAIKGTPRQHDGPQPSDVAFFLLSGGTTGLPKLIPRTHDDYAFQMRATAEAMGFDETQAYLAALPIAHNAALGCPGALGALWAGGRAVLASSPSPDEVFPLIKQEGVTLTTLMPAVLSLWIDTADIFQADLSGLTIEVGGAVLNPGLGRKVRPALGATLTHWFGMAEGILCFTRRDDGDELAATTQGTPMCDGDELLIVDEDDRPLPAGEVGQLLVRGPCVLRGYYNVPEHNTTVFTSGGYLRTGDLARMTPEGRLVIAGRIKDVINRGGEKVSSDEVESHLVAHPGVRAAAVVPLPDSRLGEKICAFIVAREQPPTLAQLRDLLRERGLADFKLPDRLEIIDSLPQTNVGKIDKRKLVTMLTEGA